MINDNTPKDPANTASEQYLHDEVVKVNVALQKTRLVSILSVVAAFAYLGIMTANYEQYTQPAVAAEIAKGMIAQKVADSGPDIIEQVKQQIPILISQVPEYAQQQLPVYRQNLEDQFEKDLTTNLTKGSKDLDTKLDDYLEANKDQIKLALTSGQDSGAVKQLGDGIGKEFMTSLTTISVNGETIQEKLDSSLDSLNQVQTKMDRLANAKDLTPQEKKTRHAIAIMTKMINRETPKATPMTTASAQ